jgi:ribonuclease HI
MSEPAKMHIDGASRGNPGRAAYAVVLARPGVAVVEEADVIGTATNNVAEYTALIKGLELARELGVTHLEVFSDSELMVKQMNGEYKVKHADMRPLYERASALRSKFAQVTLTHVRREQNARADLIGNEALDGKPRRRGQGGALPADAGPPAPRAPKANADDAAIRADALQCLADAARHWAEHGLKGLPPEAVWEQLWSLIAEAGLLKKKAK